MSLVYSGAEPQPSLAWQFQSSNVDIVTGLAPSSQVSPGPAQLQGSAALVTNAPTSNTAIYCTGPYGTNSNYMNLGTSTPAKFDYNSSNLFCEFWWYTSNTVAANLNTPISLSDPSSTAVSFRTQVRRNSGFGFNSSTSTSNTTVLASQTWYHFAFSIDSTNKVVYLFVNGFGGVSASYTGTLNYNSAYSIQVGYSTALASNYYYDQYIRDLRVVQGGVVPVANFTPGAAPFSYASPGYVANMGTTVFTLLGQFVTYNPSGKYGASAIMRNLVTRYTWPFTPSINSGVTISFWIKFDVLGGWISGSSGTSFGDRYYSFINGTPRFELVFVDNTTSYKGVTSSVVPSISTWYHVTYVFGNGSISQYINGNINGTRSDTPQMGLVFDTNLAFGGLAGSTTGTSKFELDDLRIYNTALTSTQVQSVYSSQGAPAPSRAMPLPKLAWDFNGTTADYVTGLNGVNNGTSVNKGFAYTTGKYNQSLIIRNDVTGQGAPGVSNANNLVYSLTGTYSTVSGFAITTWFNCTSLSSSYRSIPLFFQGINWGVFLIFQGGSGINCQYYDGTSYPGSPGGLIPVTGVWNHIAMVMIGNNLGLYVNGVYVGAAVSSIANSSTCSLTLSDQYAPTWGQYDDLRIFDRALTSAQVQSIYNQQGVPGRGGIVKSPIQPGYIYELNNNTTNVGTPNVAIINSSNPDPRIYLAGNTSRIANWNTVPNLLTLWDTAPFKYYMMFLTDGYTYPVNIPTTGTYQIDILFVGPGGDIDSFFIHMDSDADTIATSYPSYPTSFTWLTALTKTLTAGAHTVQITAREPSGLAAIRVIPNGGVAPTLTAFRQNLTGTPLFTQLSSAATSSAVGAFSLRAVNGVTAKAVQIRPQAQFPPVAMTSNGPQNMTGYPFGGSGNYTTSSSTGTAWSAFDNNPTTFWETTGSPSNLTYNTLENGGVYIGSVTTTIDGVSTAGEWIQLELPTAITIVNYSMYARPGFTTRMSRNFTLAGSNDGTSWTTVNTQTNITSWSGQTPITFTVNSSVLYKYFRLVVTAVVGSSGSNQRLDIAGITYIGSPPAQDFYADRLGNLLTTPVVGQPLANWLGGATGYVTTWYDQSGKGNHASQATAANQPIIQRATKGPGYSTLWPGLTSTRLIYGTSSNLFDSTNYSVCVAAKRTTAVSTTTYYAGTNGQSVTNQNLGVGYSNDTTLRLTEYGYSLNAPTVSAYAGVSEPLGYDFFTFSQTSGMRNYTWRSGTSASNTNTGLTTPLSRSGNSTIGGTNDSASFTGEIYELLVFTQSLYDLDTSGGLVTQIYNNQLSAYGT